ncbi:MAG TPA: S24 family peptidase [Stellaceae bacterium]|jgi:hypothetical protein|nr:S24 family peptidase [Stellaceae bacterium]
MTAAMLPASQRAPARKSRSPGDTGFSTTPSGNGFQAGRRSAEPHREQTQSGSFQIPAAVLTQIPVEHRNDLFILALDGNCLEPEVRHNDYALIVPGMPIRRGDFVVLWPKDPEHRPLIKRVVLVPPKDWATWSPDSEVMALIVVEQLNPPRLYHIPVDKLSAIHRVMMTFRPGDYEHATVESPRPSRRRTAGGAA